MLIFSINIFILEYQILRVKENFAMTGEEQSQPRGAWRSWTNNIYLIEDIDISDPIGKSDHAVISINTNIVVEVDCFVKRRLYYKGQYDKMRSFFSDIDWKTKLSLLDTQASWDVVLEHICSAIDEFIPMSKNSKEKDFKQS